ncbi:periplasmic heavy metal sensor [Geodermatophilus chilensis]|nr:hypothetical protein [Geodermatophilus chilensis]
MFDLDQAIIDAGRNLLAALTADPLDPDTIAAAREALQQAREARGYA